MTFLKFLYYSKDSSQRAESNRTVHINNGKKYHLVEIGTR